MQGYNELRDAAAWLDVSGRGKIRVRGEDRARLLHAMSTNHIQQLTPGTGCYAFFLTAQGRILADVNVLCRQDSFLLDTEPETVQKLLEHLERFIIADDVTVEDFTSALATFAIEGPKSAEVLTAAGVPVPGICYGANLDWNAALVARLNATGSTGFFVIVPTAEKDVFLSKIHAAGAVAADKEAFNIVRLEHGKPRYGEDISDRYLAQEANQGQALHYHKGCYLGQEVVERLRSRGLISRVLKALEIEGQSPPEPRTKLKLGGAPAGEITSAAYSPALGKVVALGYVRTDYAEPGTEMTAGDLRARVRTL
ncbi:MAG: glycine cleavage T C-terminal barrel domain-containing protein [Acidobacteriota bacterium]